MPSTNVKVLSAVVMSRTGARPAVEDATVKLWVGCVGYAPPKPSIQMPYGSIVFLVHGLGGFEESGTLASIADTVQHLLFNTPDEKSNSPNFILVDLANLVTKEALPTALREDAMDRKYFGKTVGKPLARTLEKLRLQAATIVACGSMCQYAAKLLVTEGNHGLMAYENAVSRVVFIHPDVPAKHAKNLLPPAAGAARPILDIVFVNEESRKEEPAFRAAFPAGTSTVSGGEPFECMVKALYPDLEGDTPALDTDLCDGMGRTLWLGEMTAEMSKITKHSELLFIDTTEDIVDEHKRIKRRAGAKAVAESSSNAAGEAGCEGRGATDKVGALILRGNRCVLVRSLDDPPEWEGMRIPSIVPAPGEASYDTALRALDELTEIDAAENVYELGVAPAVIYGKEGNVTVHVVYAVQEPPEGPLEDADMEDDEDLYDWYTFPRAVKRLDDRSVDMLRTVAFQLHAAAAAGLVPDKWGGVFGKEFVKKALGGQGKKTEKSAKTAWADDDGGAGSGDGVTLRFKKPFHPQRLYDATRAVGELNVSCGEGIVWIASSAGHRAQSLVSVEGGQMKLLPGTEWWAEVPKSEWPEGLQSELEGIWTEEYGDRGSELVLKGPGIEMDTVKKALEGCLLTDDEFSAGVASWMAYADPFEAE